MAVERGGYRFRSVWHLGLGCDAVFDVLADLGGYPRWWPHVRSVEQYDDESAALVVRSALPYSLRLHASRVREDRARGVLEARLGGDLEGWSRWTLRPAGVGCQAVFEEQVVARGRFLRRRVGRPIFELNHAWMMRAGERGLRSWLSNGPNYPP